LIKVSHKIMILEAAVRMPAITQRERSRTTAVVLGTVLHVNPNLAAGLPEDRGEKYLDRWVVHGPGNEICLPWRATRTLPFPEPAPEGLTDTVEADDPIALILMILLREVIGETL
jgi:hypothetical protein